MLGFAGNLYGLSEIPCLHFDCVDGKIGDVDVARPQAFCRELTRILAWATVMKLVAAPVRQREGRVVAADTCRRVPTDRSPDG